MKRYLIFCLVLFYSQVGLSSQAYVAPNIALTGSTANKNANTLKHEEQYHNSTYEVEELVGCFLAKRKVDQKTSEYLVVNKFQKITYYSCGQHMLDYRERIEYVRPATEEEIKNFESTVKFLYGVLVIFIVMLIVFASMLLRN